MFSTSIYASDDDLIALSADFSHSDTPPEVTEMSLSVLPEYFDLQEPLYVNHGISLSLSKEFSEKFSGDNCRVSAEIIIFSADPSRGDQMEDQPVLGVMYIDELDYKNIVRPELELVIPGRVYRAYLEYQSYDCDLKEAPGFERSGSISFLVDLK
jgi:hypothetical protein